MTLKEFYKQIDSDYKDVIKRLCDENMIKKFVFKFPEDPSFNDLKDGLKENDAEKAFCAVHTLKGVCSNLGFERLYEASYELTEKLRNRVIDNCDELYNAVERLYTDLIAKIKELINLKYRLQTEVGIFCHMESILKAQHRLELSALKGGDCRIW